MKKILLLILLIPLVSALRINEVMYNPEGSETSMEYIELFNSQDNDINISNYIIETQSYDEDAILPENAIIKAKSYYLIADTGFNENKPDYYPEADYEEQTNLGNTGGYAVLRDNDSNEISRVEWEGAGIEGMSYDGDYNFPSPSNSIMEFNDNLLDINLEVIEADFEFIEINITDENPIKNGIQIFPEINKEFNITIKIKDSLDSLDGVKVEFNENEYILEIFQKENDVKTFSKTFDLPFEADNYLIKISAFSDTKTIEEELKIEVLEVLSFEIDIDEIDIIASKGKLIEIFGDDDINTYDKPTIKNTGNSPIRIFIKSFNLVNEESSIKLENVEVQIGDKKGNLSEEYKSDLINVNEELPIHFFINIPINADAGKYHGELQIIASK